MAAGTAKTMISAEIGNAFLCTCVRVCVIAFEWACFCESMEVVFDVHGCSWFRPCSALPVRWLLQRIRLRLLQKSSAQFLLPVSGEAFPLLLPMCQQESCVRPLCYQPVRYYVWNLFVLTWIR